MPHDHCFSKRANADAPIDGQAISRATQALLTGDGEAGLARERRALRAEEAAPA
ncbi:MAG: hypothetical protein NZM11_00925 [Anaerolineales bacterium]|nr:hypothetical protein [Anaerolineales bacterium]